MSPVKIISAICPGVAVHPLQVHRKREPSLGGMWATGTGRAKGTAKQLPVAVWLTLPGAVVIFWMHPTQVKVTVSGQTNLSADPSGSKIKK